MKDAKKVTFVNEDGKFRLQAIEMVQNGETMHSVAKSIGVHQTTISDWMHMYNTEGVERLNTYRRPISRHHLDIAELEGIIEKTDGQDKTRLELLLRVAKGEKLRTISRDVGISVQMLIRYRKRYLNGDLPKVLCL